MTTKLPKVQKAQVSVTVDVATKERLCKMAQDNHLPVSAMMSQLIWGKKVKMEAE